MTESIADGLSAVGLIVGFPLLLLGFMLSLEKLETWGLRDTSPPAEDLSTARVTVDAAVHEVEQLATANTETDRSSAVGRRSVG